ncbi:DUF6879 family protein [Actinomadura sp. 1N219]|uniref:DUF6879 family protein n=1 Tax=Actinomadura sp. 1N219 TaxID=3375152 RepID=UPI0037B927B8
MECRQSYQEAEGIRSQEAYRRGDVSLARSLPEKEAMGAQPLRDEVRARNLDFTRVRLLAYPLTDYLRHEMGCASLVRSFVVGAAGDDLDGVGFDDVDDAVFGGEAA